MVMLSLRFHQFRLNRENSALEFILVPTYAGWLSDESIRWNIRSAAA